MQEYIDLRRDDERLAEDRSGLWARLDQYRLLSASAPLRQELRRIEGACVCHSLGRAVVSIPPCASPLAMCQHLMVAHSCVALSSLSDAGDMGEREAKLHSADQISPPLMVTGAAADLPLGLAVTGAGALRLEGKDGKESKGDAKQATPQARALMQQQVEGWLAQTDRMHSQLLDLVQQLQIVSDRVVKLQALKPAGSAPAAPAKESKSAGAAAAAGAKGTRTAAQEAELRTNQARLKRLRIETVSHTSGYLTLWSCSAHLYAVVCC